MKARYDPSVKFDPLAEEHDSLANLLAEFRRMLERREDRREAMIEKLSELTQHVEAHFVHEERRDGFFDVVVDQAPRLKDRADSLVQEHADFTGQLRRMERHAKQGVPSDDWWNELSERFQQFSTSFSRHEREENELVQSAFNEDIGAED